MKLWMTALLICGLAYQGIEAQSFEYGNSLATNEPLLAAVAATDVTNTRNPPEMAGWKIEAAQAAQDYVNLLDQGRYGESWDRGSVLFQHTISKKEWNTALTLARKRLGPVRSRTLKDERPAWDPKGLPKGPYMVVEYNTSFQRAPNSGELLTLRRDEDGKWKVLTYKVN